MLEREHPVYISRAIQNKAEQASKDTMYLSGLIPRERSGLEFGHVCHLHFHLVLQGELPAPFRASSCRATVSETRQSGPQHKGGRA